MAIRANSSPSGRPPRTATGADAGSGGLDVSGSGGGTAAAAAGGELCSGVGDGATSAAADTVDDALHLGVETAYVAERPDRVEGSCPGTAGRDHLGVERAVLGGDRVRGRTGVVPVMVEPTGTLIARPARRKVTDLRVDASSGRWTRGVGVGFGVAAGAGAAAEPPDPPELFTTTSPVISGWIAHRYENVPACLNVRFHDPPSPIGPLLNAPSSAVTVCARSSSLRNVTEPPAAIVTVPGLNARPAIETEADVDDEAAEVEPPPPELAPPPTTIRPK